MKRIPVKQRNVKLNILIPCVLFFFQFVNAQTDLDKTYINPVIPGNHPDPTLTQIGNDFYSSGSSFNPTPKIYHSSDLVNWEVISQPVNGASISYKMKLPADVKTVTVHVVVKSTLAFINLERHRYKVGFDGGGEQVVNFNSDLNEKPENIYSIFYPTVARRMSEKVVELNEPVGADGMQELTLTPLDPGIVFEKIVVDFGGYKNAYLFC